VSGSEGGGCGEALASGRGQTCLPDLRTTLFNDALAARVHGADRGLVTLSALALWLAVAHTPMPFAASMMISGWSDLYPSLP
jgi:hypothetical protein